MSYPEMDTYECTTLTQAKDWLREQLRKKGGVCPCCTQLSKVYKRKLNSTMARGLVWLVGQAGADRRWVDVSSEGPKWLLGKGGTLATMSHWGLIESKGNETSGKRCSGVWRPTTKGVGFLLGRIKVAKYVFLYDGSALRFSDEQLSIAEALGQRFHYGQLMREQGVDVRGLSIQQP